MRYEVKLYKKQKKEEHMANKIAIPLGWLQAKYGDKKAIAFAKEAGADAVELILRYNDFQKEDSVYSKGDEAVIAYYSELREYIEELGLFVSQTQGRITGFLNDKEKDEAFVENTRLDCLATATLGAPILGVHNATSMRLGPNVDAKLMHQLSYDMYTSVLPYAKQYGIKIATVTFGDAVHYVSCDFFGQIEEFTKAYKNIKRIKEFKKHFTICMDTGHTNKAERFGNPSPADTIRILGKEISSVHLNDNDRIHDSHKMPMMGTINWEDVFNALDEIGYNGVYTMFINTSYFGDGFEMEYAKFAIKFLRYKLEEREKKKSQCDK